MAAALSVAYTATPLAAGVKLIIFATRGVSAGINFMPKSEFKFIQVSAAAAASPANILTAYTALYGALIAGQKIFIRGIAVDANGFASTALDSNIVVS